jgi:hypothetical protein
MGAMTSLDMSKNELLTKEGGEILGKMLKTNSVLKDLNVSQSGWCLSSSKQDGPGFAQKLAVGIKDNGALVSLDISTCDLMAEGGKALAAGLKGNQVITELNISGSYLGLKSDYRSAENSGIIAIADAIPDMGALTSLNLSKNGMQGAEAGKALGDALATNTVLKELDLSGQPKTSICYAKPNMDVAFVKVFAPGLSDNGALTSLDISSNSIGVWTLPHGWEKHPTLPQYRSPDGKVQDTAPEGSKPEGIIAIANAIPGMRALIKLDISSNDIGGEQEGELQRVCVASGIELDK